jgi:chromosome segregation ATPase
VNPFDVLTAPPALVRRAFEDLHDIARLARHYAGVEDDILARVESAEVTLTAMRRAVAPLSKQLGQMEQHLAELKREVEPIRHLAPIRAGIEPLAQNMIEVRESVDELEPMVANLDKRVQAIEPQLEEVRESVEPVGDLAERIPGIGRRRG